jgi:hypothetical protein
MTKHIRTSSAATVLISWGIFAWGCDGGTTPTDAMVGPQDAGRVLPPSELFGPCVEDSQCPGEGAVCRPSSDGYPGGYCTVPCEDRTPCDYRGVYHHCALRDGETRAYCERRCLNGIDCGRDGYTCVGELPPSGGYCIAVCSSDEQCGEGTICNRYSGQCQVGSVGEGGVTGDPCNGPEDCLSGQCIGEVDASGAPTGWNGGYCAANCILPAGYSNSQFWVDSVLPQSTCVGDAVCLPSNSNSRGDLGTCYDACTGDGDCRAGYTCLKDIQLGNGTVRNYENGLCVPAG